MYDWLTLSSVWLSLVLNRLLNDNRNAAETKEGRRKKFNYPAQRHCSYYFFHIFFVNIAFAKYPSCVREPHRVYLSSTPHKAYPHHCCSRPCTSARRIQEFKWSEIFCPHWMKSVRQRQVVRCGCNVSMTTLNVLSCRRPTICLLQTFEMIDDNFGH